MIEVRPKDSSYEAFEEAIKKFTKKVNKSNHLKILREKKYFKKPSEIKHERARQVAREMNNKKRRKK